MSRIKQPNLFDSNQLTIVDQAAVISEDVISNHFKLTVDNWKKFPYDLRTLHELTDDEIVPEVFAQIIRYGRPGPPERLRQGDFYRICIQDHNILLALSREPQLKLLPLLIYCITHELIHIIRFYKFFQFFHADDNERAAEETRVHTLTYELLRSRQLTDFNLIFDFYARHRQVID